MFPQGSSVGSSLFNQARKKISKILSWKTVFHIYLALLSARKANTHLFQFCTSFRPSLKFTKHFLGIP